MPVMAEYTAPLLPSRSAGASLDAAHSCQVEESALGSAVELSRSSACLSLRTAARTQRRLFFDSANLDNDDGVALNKVSKGSLEDMRASKGSLEHRLVSRSSLNSRQISKGGTAVVSPAVVPTAALMGAALAGQQSMQRPLPAVLHRIMAPVAAVLIATLLAIVTVCAAHYLWVRRGTHATVQQCHTCSAGPSPCLPAFTGSARAAAFAKHFSEAVPVIAWHRLICASLGAPSI